MAVGAAPIEVFFVDGTNGTRAAMKAALRHFKDDNHAATDVEGEDGLWRTRTRIWDEGAIEICAAARRSDVDGEIAGNRSRVGVGIQYHIGGAGQRYLNLAGFALQLIAWCGVAGSGQGINIAGEGHVACRGLQVRAIEECGVIDGNVADIILDAEHAAQPINGHVADGHIYREGEERYGSCGRWHSGGCCRNGGRW